MSFLPNNFLGRSQMLFMHCARLFPEELADYRGH